MPSPHPQIRVLHVLGSLGRGGVETWLASLAKLTGEMNCRMDFCCLAQDCGVLAPEVRASGAKVHLLPLSAGLCAFSLGLYRLIRREGYDVVDSHVHHFSGYVLGVARIAGVPVRVAHSHNTHDGKTSDGFRWAYRRAMRCAMRLWATHGVAVSEVAGRGLFGSEGGVKWQVLHCGIDLTRFSTAPHDSNLRLALGMPANAFVVGHVGRLDPQKNTEFLIRAFRGVARVRPNAHLLIVGEGSLRPRLEQVARDLGINHRVWFAGLRGDVPLLMINAIDLLCLPSRHEGLPIVLLEAQAAGVRSLVSDAITAEGDVVSGLVERLPIDQGEEPWVRGILRAEGASRIDQRSALDAMKRSGFCASASAEQLVVFYRRAVDEASGVTSPCRK